MEKAETAVPGIVESESAEKDEQLYCATAEWLRIVRILQRRRNIWKAIALVSIFLNVFLLLCFSR